MIFANDIDRTNYYAIQSDLPHVTAAHKAVMLAISHIDLRDLILTPLHDAEKQLQARIAEYDDEIKAIEAREEERKRNVAGSESAVPDICETALNLSKGIV
jgi:hypothetical protein